MTHSGYLRIFLMIILSLALPANSAEVHLPPPTKSYNILMLLPVSSMSHRNVFRPLAAALAQRGHKVTMVSNHPPPDQNPNITYIDRKLPYFDQEQLNVFEIRDDTLKMFKLFSEALPLMAKYFYKVPVIKELFERRENFDLAIIDSFFNEIAYPFVAGKKFITISTAGLEMTQSAVMGNVLNPAYVVSLSHTFELPMTLLQRVQNLLFSVFFAIMWKHWAIVPLVQKEITEQFPSLPSLLEIERNQTLVLMNSHFSISSAIPVLPSQVEVGGMHCSPGKKLPKNLEDFVSGNVPVVYFSLGSVARGVTIPVEYRDIIIKSFTKLPYKFIWKFEENLKDLPKNIIVDKWLPQQDIIAHSMVKVFVSHCGLLSTQEAMYHGIPVLGLPVFADQPKNAKELEMRGLGKMLIWEELTVDTFTTALRELVENPSYAKNMAEVSALFKDQPQTPLERAVFWTEYAARYPNADHLRSPQLDLTWVELLHLDIIFVMHLLIFTLVKLFKIGYNLMISKKKERSEKIKAE